ncbi:MAG: 5-formyltetrahydrofolate cyclo-ligase [Candidatus Omnitrophota bacterium]
MVVPDAKALLRNRMRRKIATIPSATCCRKSGRLFRKLIGLPAVREAAKFLVYVSFKKEPGTHRLIRYLLRCQKEVYVPKVDRAHSRMKGVRIRHLERDLVRGAYGIPEPRKGLPACARPSAIEIAIVPGLAFDRCGRRLGRGGGYFDRFLRPLRRTIKIGYAFREQCVKKVPAGPNDIRMDAVLTD